METKWLGIWALALIVPAGLGSCGSDEGDGPSDSQIRAYCETICAKQAECGFLMGQSEAGCVTTCSNGASQGSSECSVTQSEVNACINAIDGLECNDLMTGNIPEACNLCPEDNHQQDAGHDTGMPETSSAGCSDLAPCCNQIPEEGREGCLATVDAGNDMSCGAALSTYRQVGFCQ